MSDKDTASSQRQGRPGLRSARFVGSGMAAACIVMVSLLMPQPAAAQPLYFYWANVNPSAVCNADQHTLEFRMSMLKDSRYATQSYQFQYRLTNLQTGATAYTSVATRTAYTNGDTYNSNVLPMPAGGRWRADYIVRFGTLSGYNAWSAWTPTGHIQVYARYGYYWDESPVCYT